MTKKDFIALANTIRNCNGTVAEFGTAQIAVLAAHLGINYPLFDRAKWEGYVLGKLGPNGGKL